MYVLNYARCGWSDGGRCVHDELKICIIRGLRKARFAYVPWELIELKIAMPLCGALTCVFDCLALQVTSSRRPRRCRAPAAARRREHVPQVQAVLQDVQLAGEPRRPPERLPPAQLPAARAHPPAISMRDGGGSTGAEGRGGYSTTEAGSGQDLREETKCFQ